MTFVDWISAPVNWAFTIIGLAVLVSGFRVVTSKNVVHAALYLVGTLAGTAGLFLMLSAEFVAWVLVLVYIGAVIVLFLFGIMITRAPTGLDEGLSSDHKVLPAVLALAMFLMMAWA
ncbi:MAG: NADH-quinone oxidoreductase subunit J [Acidimicrobiia bacterium]